MQLDTIVCGDCLDVMRDMDANSVDLIVTDPPYYRVKGEWWDRQWDNAQGFLDWIGSLCAEWQRILKPNGSLYVFVSPHMAARVECKIGERFNVLNHIVWNKDEQTYTEKYGPERFRHFVDKSERIIFAEHYGDNKQTILGHYIKQTREAAKLKGTDIDIALGYVRTKDKTRGTELCRRWEEGASIPKLDDFIKIMHVCGIDGNGDLCHKYEDLLRPFNATPHAPYTDVWTFKTVAAYPGKHPCEKPLPLIEHIIQMSSRPGAIVADFFMGSGTTAEAALKTGRHWYGCDISQEWVSKANQRITRARLELSQVEMLI